MSTVEWEDRCRRCSRCCYEKVEYEGEIYYTEVPCERLDLSTRLCTVYERRSEVVAGCAVLTEEIVRRGFLPPDCPYVDGIEGYKSPHLADEEGL